MSLSLLIVSCVLGDADVYRGCVGVAVLSLSLSLSLSRSVTELRAMLAKHKTSSKVRPPPVCSCLLLSAHYAQVARFLPWCVRQDCVEKTDLVEKVLRVTTPLTKYAMRFLSCSLSPTHTRTWERRLHW